MASKPSQTVNLKQYRRIGGKWQFVPVGRGKDGKPDSRFVIISGEPANSKGGTRAGSANSDKGLSGGSVRPQPKMAGMRRADEQTSASEPHSDFQGEGGFGRHQGRKDTFGVGAGV